MKIAIFEDEIHNCERLMRLLKQCDMNIEVTAVISSVAEGVKWMKEQHAVDLMLMDIQLSDGNCFELFGQAAVTTPVIFTTAYDNFALQAFRVNSIDYLLKPVELKELRRALNKYEQFRPSAAPVVDISRIADEFLRRNSTRFIGKINNQLVYVKAQDIAYLQFIKGITYAITASGQRIPLDYSLDQVERLLDRNVFFRINRQFIIHLDAIRRITTYYNSRLILQLQPATDGDVIISRERVGDFKSWLEGNAEGR